MSSLSMTSTRYRRRKFVNQVMTILAYVCTAAAIIPLTWIVVYVVIKGLGAWNTEFFTDLPKLFGTGGGVSTRRTAGPGSRWFTPPAITSTAWATR